MRDRSHIASERNPPVPAGLNRGPANGSLCAEFLPTANTATPAAAARRLPCATGRQAGIKYSADRYTGTPARANQPTVTSLASVVLSQWLEIPCRTLS